MAWSFYDASGQLRTTDPFGRGVIYSPTPPSRTDVIWVDTSDLSSSYRMKVGSVAVANATGNQVVSGLGFRPALVKLMAVQSADSANPARGIGAMDSAGNQWAHTTNSIGTAHDRYRTNRCIYLITAAGVVGVEASYVSMDDDGFTINVVREDGGVGATILLYEAYA